MSKSASVIVRIVASCLVAGGLVFGISILAGEDLTKTHVVIAQADGLLAQIGAETGGGIDQRVRRLGEVPENDALKKQYCIALAKEIQGSAHLAEKQRILFDSLDAGAFENRLQQILQLTKALDVAGLQSELQSVKDELQNAGRMVERKRNRLSRQRFVYLGIFLVVWAAAFFYFGRGAGTGGRR